MSEPTLTRRTVDAFGWSALASAGESLLSLAVLAVLSRLLSPRDFGVVAIALIFIGVINATGKLGIGPAIIQRTSLTRRHIVTGFTLSAALGALLTTALWSIAPATGRFFDAPAVPAILGALSAVFIITGLGVISEFLLRRDLCFKQLMIAGILSQAGGYGLVAMTMALLEYGAWSLVGGLVARHALFTAVVMAFRPPPFRLGVARREAAEILRFGTGYSFCSLLITIASQGSRFVIGSGLGAAPLGYYMQAFRVAAGMPSRLGLVLKRVLFPAMAERQQWTDRLGPVYLHGIEMVSLLAVPAAIFMATCAPEIIAVLFGRQWDAAVPVLEILAVGIAFHACNVINVPAIRALGAVYRESWRRGLHALLVILGVWLGIRWGLAGAAAAIVGARIVLHLLLTHLMLSLLGLGWRRLLQCHAPALWAGAWSAGALWLATELARWAALPAAATLAAGVAACGAAAAGATYGAPGFVRPRSIRWGLEHLPFPKLGTTGRLLRFVLERLDRNPATHWRQPDDPPAM